MSELKTLTLHGDRIAYHDEGCGEVLLLIHGMAGSSQTWRALLPRLSMRYRVVAPDLLGHGQSDKPRGDYSLGAFAVWLRDLLEALGIREATVVGHSLGGGVAMQFSHQHRAYCQRLVLISSGGLGSDVGLPLRLISLPGSEALLPLIASSRVINAGNGLRSRLASRGMGHAGFDESWRAYSSLSNRESRQAFLRTLRSVVDHRGQAVSALNRLHLVSDLPTLIVCGERDHTIPAAHGYAAHSKLPGSRFHLVASGHHPHVECPQTVAKLVDDFITTHSEHSLNATAARSG